MIKYKKTLSEEIIPSPDITIIKSLTYPLSHILITRITRIKKHFHQISPPHITFTTLSLSKQVQTNLVGGDLATLRGSCSLTKAVLELAGHGLEVSATTGSGGLTTDGLLGPVVATGLLVRVTAFGWGGFIDGFMDVDRC